MKDYLLIGGSSDGERVKLAHPYDSIDIPVRILWEPMKAADSSSSGPGFPAQLYRLEKLRSKNGVEHHVYFFHDRAGEGDLIAQLIAGYRVGVPT